jgi:hypothetical protein
MDKDTLKLVESWHYNCLAFWSLVLEVQALELLGSVEAVAEEVSAMAAQLDRVIAGTAEAAEPPPGAGTEAHQAH